MKTLERCAAFLICAVALCSCKPSRPATGLVFLIAVGTNQASPAGSPELQRVAKVVTQRVDALGYPVWLKHEGSNVFSVTLPLSAQKESDALRSIMTKAGLLQFFFVHEESQRLVQEDLTPAGYRKMKETRTGFGGSQEVVFMVVEKRAVADVSGRNIKNSDVIRGPMNDARVAFELDPPGRDAFAKLTGASIGRQLAIVLDGELLSAPIIRSQIDGGNVEISGGSLSQKEALNLSILMRLPLEMPVRIVEERTY